MTVRADCSCDESKHWRERALRAETKLEASRTALKRVLAVVDAAIFLHDVSSPTEEVEAQPEPSQLTR